MIWFSKRRLLSSFLLAMAALGIALTLGWSQPANAVTARRFCDRLVELGAARELTGRETFRLYGI